MSLFDHQRLTQDVFHLDIEGLRKGIYTDKYFTNVVRVLAALSEEGYAYSGTNPRNLPDFDTLRVGDVIVEAQIFNRRSPIALIAGVDVALTMLKHATGFYDDGKWIDTADALEVDAVQDGDITYYDGDPENVLTVIEVRGRYRDFALLETPILGILSRASRIATNVYEVLQVSNGKQILYYPARFDLPDVQAIDGYAYYLAVKRYNEEYKQTTNPTVSTDAQGLWWGGKGKGTIPHALIACFGADDTEMMLNFARHMPLETPRILLADFDNDTVAASVRTLNAFWEKYWAAHQAGDETAMKQYTLNGVRLDTSAKLRDVSLHADDPKGVSPVLVRTVRNALNNAWHAWTLTPEAEAIAQEFCKQVQIVVTGGFNRDKIELFERARAPVDAYGVGSSLLSNAKDTNTDFTMDVVRIFHNAQWIDVPKVGRRPCDNPDLRRVSLTKI